MGGFVLLFSRDGAPIPKFWCEAALSAVTAPDSRREGRYFPWGFAGTAILPGATIHGETLALKNDRDQSKTTLLDGRIDNLDTLVPRFDPPLESSPLSVMEAALSAQSHITSADFLGSFCAFQVDAIHRSVTLLRDYLGDRTLFYFLDAHHFFAASELGPLLTIPEIDRTLDRERLAAFFGVQQPPEGHSFYQSIRELPAGSRMTVHRENVHWRPRPPLDIKRQSFRAPDSDLAHQFKKILGQAIECRLEHAIKPAISLSGGLDSGTVAAFAVRQTKRTNLQAFSFIFDQLKGCDEREHIKDLVRSLDISTRLFPCDDAWPLKDFQDWPFNPETPEENPYRLLKERLYAAASESECGLLLTGAFGDPLYLGGNHWLLEAIRAGALSHACKHAFWHGKELGWYRFFRSAAFKRLLGAGEPRNDRPPWLTKKALSLLDSAVTEPRAGRPEQANALLGTYAAHGSAAERFHANRHGLILRHPFRDRRLVEFVLGLPAHQLYRQGRFKIILRHATKDLLPDKIRLRTLETSLKPLFEKGLLEKERERCKALIELQTNSIWRDFVDPLWVHDVQNRPFQNEREALAYWNLLCFIRWESK